MYQWKAIIETKRFRCFSTVELQIPKRFEHNSSIVACISGLVKSWLLDLTEFQIYRVKYFRLHAWKRWVRRGRFQTAPFILPTTIVLSIRSISNTDLPNIRIRI